VVVDAAARADARSVNLVMLGALAAELGEPSLEDLRSATRELFGKKLGGAAAQEAALEAGFA
jgi:Pyruvate/2-oxoacid:ferredoxin oxidoreductase gamma subunit